MLVAVGGFGFGLLLGIAAAFRKPGARLKKPLANKSLWLIALIYLTFIGILVACFSSSKPHSRQRHLLDTIVSNDIPICLDATRNALASRDRPIGGLDVRFSCRAS